MNITKKNKIHSPIVKNQKQSDGLLVSNNGVVIDTTDDAFNGGVCIDLLKIYE